MKYLVLAAVLIGAAWVGSEPMARAVGAPNYEDARSHATDAEIRVARRAYRAACQQHNSTGYCECMTGGMAQALSPSELAVATAAFTGARVTASSATRAHVEAIRADVDRGCAGFR
jgi:hypothetical protein